MLHLPALQSACRSRNSMSARSYSARCSDVSWGGGGQSPAPSSKGWPHPRHGSPASISSRLISGGNEPRERLTRPQDQQLGETRVSTKLGAVHRAAAATSTGTRPDYG